MLKSLDQDCSFFADILIIDRKRHIFDFLGDCKGEDENLQDRRSDQQCSRFRVPKSNEKFLDDQVEKAKQGTKS